jgi:hypothetical protein
LTTRTAASFWNVFVVHGAHMTGRRRHRRFVVSPLVTGVLEVLEDAVMESASGAEFVITTTTAPVVGDQAMLHLEGETGTHSIRVRVVETQLHVAEEGVRHRVRLANLDAETAPQDAAKRVLE